MAEVCESFSDLKNVLATWLMDKIEQKAEDVLKGIIAEFSVSPDESGYNVKKEMVVLLLEGGGENFFYGPLSVSLPANATTRYYRNRFSFSTLGH